jgi:hypothetical protein
VFIGPPRGPALFFEQFCRFFDLRPGLEDAVRGRLERHFGMPLADCDLPRMAGAQEARLLVIHDRGDAEVPWEDGAAIARAWPGAILETTRGLGHRRILREPEVVARAAAFAVEGLGRCGCGRPAARWERLPGLCDRCALERELFDRSARPRPGAEGQGWPSSPWGRAAAASPDSTPR